MNSSISKSQVGAVSHEERMKLSSVERILLLLPIAGWLVFGLGPLRLGGAFGAASLFVTVVGTIAYQRKGQL